MRSILTGLVMLASVAGAAWGQNARIGGHVVTPDGKPIAGAQVRIQDVNIPAAPGEHLAKAEADGSFIAELAPGGYRVRARMANFMEPDQAIPVTLKAGESQKGLLIVMLPMGIVAGTVVNAEGQPLANQRVEVLRYGGGSRALALWADHPAVETDGRGQFRIAAIPPGLYYVRVNRQGAGQRQANLTTYYPSTDFAGAQLVHVESGKVAQADLKMLRGSVFPVRGRVEGAPSDGRLQFELVPRTHVGNAEPVFNVRTPGPSEFQVPGVPPGDYTMIARWEPPARTGGQALVGRTELTVKDSNVEGVVVRLNKGLSFTGRVRVESEEWKSFLSAPVDPNYPRRIPSLTFSPLEASRTSVVKHDQEQGTFSVSGLVPGPYDPIIAAIARGYYLKSVKLDGKDVTNQPLDLRAYAAARPEEDGKIEIVIAKGGGSIAPSLPPEMLLAKRAWDDAHPPYLIMWSATSLASDLKKGVSGQRIRADLMVRTWENVAPGEYFVAVLDAIPSPDVDRVPEFAAKLESMARRVTVKDGAEVKVVAPLIGVQAAERAYAALK